MRTTIRTYSELKRLDTFKERYYYLRLAGIVGESTFGFDRYLNQLFYKSPRWLRVRDDIIIRDQACDLGMIGYEISGVIIIHHLNPITMSDIENDSDRLYDPNNLICTSHNTHQAIHFSNENILPQLPVLRRCGDTKLW